MSSSRFPQDRGLTARMGITMFLLGLLYVVFFAILISTGLSYGLVIILAAGFLVAQFWFSDRIALYSIRGKVVSPSEYPELHGTVERLCALADMPKPRVAVADTDMPNAFATGRSPNAAVICVTTGIMRRLEPAELEGVLAHELSHVAHRDVAVMTIASFLGILAGLLIRMGMYSSMMGGGRRRGGDRDQGAPAFLVILLVSVVVYAVSFLLIRVLSRYRELSADRSGAFLTGAPSALSSALVKITGDMGAIPTRDLRAAEPLNAFFFTPAISSGLSLSSLFSTHPSLERRLAQLSEIESDLGRR